MKSLSGGMVTSILILIVFGAAAVFAIYIEPAPVPSTDEPTMMMPTDSTAADSLEAAEE